MSLNSFGDLRIVGEKSDLMIERLRQDDKEKVQKQEQNIHLLMK